MFNIYRVIKRDEGISLDDGGRWLYSLMIEVYLGLKQVNQTVNRMKLRQPSGGMGKTNDS